MLEDVETGDVYRAAYLVSRGARVIKAVVVGGLASTIPELVGRTDPTSL